MDVTWQFNGEFLRISHAFAPRFDEFELEDIRWYHEDYREDWGATSDFVIERIQRAIRRVGESLHAAVFQGAAIADEMDQVLNDMRIEITDDVHAAAIPWELLADPRTGTFLALAVTGFVRTIPIEDATAPSAVSAIPRLLLVISRRSRYADIGYWTVAHGLWRMASELPGAQVEVLRPPTFDVLKQRLEEAAHNGTPFAAVHFDGHGMVADQFGLGSRAYLHFGPVESADEELIDGPTIGGVLADAGVALFTMNACRSGDTEPENRGVRVSAESNTTNAAGQPSLVEEVLRAGVIASVGMRRQIYPETASRFFSAFYREFLTGHGVAESAKTARVRLRDEPMSAGSFRSTSATVDDWAIPVVAERFPFVLTLDGASADMPAKAIEATGIPQHLLAGEVVGFGTEVTEIESAMQHAPAVYIGGGMLSGKSRLAVEYGRWASTTSSRIFPIGYLSLSPETSPEEFQRQLAAVAGPAGILIIDQADLLREETQVSLREFLATLGSGDRVVITGRDRRPTWLPAEAATIHPYNLLLPERARLGQLWAAAEGIRFDPNAYYKLLYFAGGGPGMILLFLEAAKQLIVEGEATEQEVVSWLGRADWQNIGRLSAAPGKNLPSPLALVDQTAARLAGICDSADRKLLPVFARFNVCCDADSVAALANAMYGSEPTQTPCHVSRGSSPAAASLFGTIQTGGTGRSGISILCSN